MKLQTFVGLLWPSSYCFSKFVCVSIGGQNMMFRPLVFSDFTLIFLSAYKEPYVQQVFIPNPNDTVVDAGAHIGFYTLKVAKKVGLLGKVIAIEPDTQNFQLLQKNIAINHHPNVIAIHAALSDTNGPRLFYGNVDPSQSGFYTPRSKVSTVEIVETMTLDTLLQHLGIDQIDWLKLDVEGEELKVLKGASQVLQNNKVKIITESRKTLGFLKEKGFHIRHLGDIYYFAFKECPRTLNNI